MASYIYLNKVNSSSPNSVINLDDLNKQALMKELQRVAIDQDERFVLAPAEPLPEVDKQPGSELITLGEWLEQSKITLSRSDKHRLANIVSRRYYEAHLQKPRIVSRPDNKGKYWLKASGFTVADLDILRQSLLELRGLDVDSLKNK